MRIKDIESVDRPRPDWTELCDVCECLVGTPHVSMFATVDPKGFEVFAKRYAAKIAKDPIKVVYIVIGTTE